MFTFKGRKQTRKSTGENKNENGRITSDSKLQHSLTHCVVHSHTITRLKIRRNVRSWTE